MAAAASSSPAGHADGTAGQDVGFSMLGVASSVPQSGSPVAGQGAQLVVVQRLLEGEQVYVDPSYSFHVSSAYTSFLAIVQLA